MKIWQKNGTQGPQSIPPNVNRGLYKERHNLIGLPKETLEMKVS